MQISKATGPLSRRQAGHGKLLREETMKLMKRGIAFAAAMAMASMPLAGAFVGASTAMAVEVNKGA